VTVSRETFNWRRWSEEEILVRGADALGCDINPGQIKLLLSFIHEIRHWNKRINLVGPSSPPDDVVLHLVDSLAPVQDLPVEPMDVLDLGSGAGLPGLVLKILRTEWNMTLAESREKKCVFLKHMARSLGLEGLRVHEKRVEPGSFHQPFDLITVRAFGSLRDIIPVASPALKCGATLLAFKGPRYRSELSDATPFISKYRLRLIHCREYTLPLVEHHRALLYFERS
jgi:16S rRNA (guanine527-N7)-methyltransferase